MSKGDGSQEARRSLFEQRLSRARFLQLVGAGVGLSLVRASLGGLGGVGVASAQTAPTPTILGSGRYPIGLYWPPPPSQTTSTRYQQIAAAGFNFVIGGNGVTNDTYNPKALQAAKANNLWYVLQDTALTTIIRNYASYSNPQAEVDKRIEALWGRYKGYYPATWAGLYLYDEPKTHPFGILGHARQKTQNPSTQDQSDGGLLPWVNLYGYMNNPTTLASVGASSYDDYLQRYRTEVNTPFISFDHYPLLSGTAITDKYFPSWAAIRRVSLQSPSIPSWCFIQSVDFKWNDNSFPARRRPNEAELFWQVNVSLAYGAKGIQYFTYWTPQDSATYTWGEALITKSGSRTPLYYSAQRVNNYLKVVGKVLLPLTSVSVVHAGEDPLPAGATAFSADGYVTSVSGSPVILGSFSDPTGGTGRYLLVVNRSFSNQASTQLALDASVSKVSKLDSSTGTFAAVTLKEPGHSLQLTIDPGKAQLYLLQ